MEMYDTPQEVSRYLNVELHCECGMTHYAPIKAVDIGEGALDRLSGYVQELGYKHPYIICDELTYKIAAQRCETQLSQAGFEPQVRILRHLAFDEATLGEIVINKPDNCDLMIGVGTGSITDMLRYSSFKLKLPCFTVATAAPMDGFAASVGIMNVDNLKATMPAHNTQLIIGDTDILSAAPYRMTVAGFGDLIGKLTALNDWRLDVLINGAHYCRRIDELVAKYVDDILDEVPQIKKRSPDALGKVMQALILTGTTISLYGNSRPISGSEHHMSHYWEAIGDQRGQQFAMHGEQVAVATVLSLMLSQELVAADVDFSAARAGAATYDQAMWETEICRTYGSASAAVIEMERKAGKNSPEGRLARIDVIESRWSEICSGLRELRSPEWLCKLLRDVGCPCCPKDIGISRDLLKDTFMFCKETRPRYTVYQLAWDLELMDELSDRVISRLEEQKLI